MTALVLVRCESEVSDELDVSFPEIATEPVLAGVVRFSGRQASRRLPFALRKEKWSISVTRRRRRDADALLLREQGPSRQSTARRPKRYGVPPSRIVESVLP
jgi:hypothetical protein